MEDYVNVIQSIKQEIINVNEDYTLRSAEMNEKFVNTRMLELLSIMAEQLNEITVLLCANKEK